MKKEKNWKRGLLSALCAVSLLGAGVFTACSSDEDDSDGSSTGGGSGPAGGQKEDSNPAESGTGSGNSSGNSDVDSSLTDGIYLIHGSEKTKKSTIKEALASIPSSAEESDTYIIQLPAGTYNEDALRYTAKANLVILGNTTKDFGSDVIIAGKGSSQASMDSRCLFSVTGSANLTLKNVTFKNTTKRSEVTETNSSGNKLTQAEALSFFSTGKLAAYNSGFYGHQDTLYTRGRSWFYKCYVEGDVDFIWMSGKDAIVALYEDCTIKMTAEENPSAAYVAAPGLDTTNGYVGKGVVIMNSKVTSDDAISSKAYLARSPWSSSCYSQVSYINTEFEKIAAGVWYGSTTEETPNNENIGWKVDSASKANLEAAGCSVSNMLLLSDRLAAREYNGRYVVLNRVYSTKTNKWESLASRWDVDSELNFGQTADSSKSNIFVDYADLSKTSIGDALTVSDYDGETSGVTWTAKAYSEITLENEVANAVSVDSNGVTSKKTSGNIYVKVTATKGEASDYVIVYSVVATGLSLSETETNIAVGSSKTLTVTFEPYGANAEIEWASDNPSVTVENGVVSVKENAEASSSATITATIKGTELKATCLVKVASAVVLKKFGTSVEGVSLEGYTKFGGEEEFLIYDNPVTPGEGVSASIKARITTKGGHAGLGFVSFRDGAYKDGSPDGYMFVTDQGVRYKKSYDSGWNGGWNASPAKKPYDDSSSGAIYDVVASLTGSGITVSFTNVETGTEYAYSNSNVRNFIANGDLYLAIGGQTDKNESLNVNEVELEVNGQGGTVASMSDLPVDTRSEISASGSLSYEMTADAFESYKGMEDSILLANVAFDGITLSPSVEGSWSWDVTSVKNSGSDFTAKASFTPADRSSYKAILSKEFAVAITDSRKDAPGAVVTETFTLGSGTIKASESPADDVVSASDIEWVNKTGSSESGLAVIGTDGSIYIPKDLVEATADYSYSTTISMTQAGKIIAVKAEAGAKGSTGNVRIDAFVSVDGGENWTELGAIVSNSAKSQYAALNYSGEIDVASSAIIQFRPHWTTAQSTTGRYTTVTDFSVTVQYSKKSEVAKVYDFTDSSYSTVSGGTGDLNSHISLASGSARYHSAQYGIETAAGSLLVLKDIATDTTNGKDIKLNFKLGYEGTASLVDPSDTTKEEYASAATVTGATSCTLNYKGEADTVGILLSNKQYIGSIELSVIE